MDSQFFRVPTQPNYYTGLTPNEARRAAYKTAVSPRNTFPAPDSRFPGYAAPMADGRLVTDYRPHCNEAVPPAQQFAVKEWIQTNTTDIIRLSRERQATMAGAQFGDDPTVVPPPSQIVQCKPTECTMLSTGAPEGIGLERVYDRAPQLFGTFELPRQRPPPANVRLTTTFEGGRNSPRGRYFAPMGNKPIAATEYLY